MELGIRRSNLKPGVWSLLALAFALVPSGLSVRAQQAPAATPNLATQDVTTGVAMLGPTRHPPVPRDLSQIWLAPVKGPSYRPVVNANLQAATGMIDRREYSKALGVLTQPSMRQGILADYSTYYAGISQLELLRFDNAERTFKALRERKPFGYLSEAAALGQARAFEGQLDFASAIRVYEDLDQRHETDAARRGLHAPRPGGPRRARTQQGGGRLRPRVLRVRVERARCRSGRAADIDGRRTGRCRHAALQARSRPRRAPVRGEAVRAGAIGVRLAARARRRRGQGDHRPAHRRVRLFPQAPAQRARRTASLHRARVAPG